MFNVLGKCPLFKGLSEAEVETLLKATPNSVRSFSKGQTIAQRDEEVRFLCVVVNGSVKGEMVDFSGKILKIEEINAPMPIAHAFLFGEKNRFPVDVVALTDCKILFIPRQEYMHLMQKNIQVMSNYLNAISSRAQFLSGKLWFLSFKTIKEKVAHYLLSLSRSEVKTTILLPKTHQELAEYFGVTRPALARVLGELEQEGIISINRREIVILDKRRLVELVK